MDREAQPEPPESEPGIGENRTEPAAPEADAAEPATATPDSDAAAPPTEPPGPLTEAEPSKPRSPVPVLASMALLWLFAVSAAWVAVISTVVTSFEVTARYSGPWGPLEFVEPLLIAAVAFTCALLALKLRGGRDWARRVVVIVSAIALALVLLTRIGLAAGVGVIGTVMFALLLVLLLLRPARDWCDGDAPRHSPRIAKAAQPPHQVVAALLLLWTAVGTALYLGSVGILAKAGDEVDLAPADAAWAAGAVFVLAIIHVALNIGYSYHRNWARWATLGLVAAYALWLIVAAARDLFEDGGGPWLLLVILCLIPLALIWAMGGADSREWCRRTPPSDQTEAEG